MQFTYASPMLEEIYSRHGGLTGTEVREKIEYALGLHSKFTEAELRTRRDEALAIVQVK